MHILVALALFGAMVWRTDARALRFIEANPNVTASTTAQEQNLVLCQYDYECGNGSCELFTPGTYVCQCSKNYVTRNDQACSYQQRSETEIFLVSLFVGFFGVDWFVLARGKAGYIVAGVFKLITIGGFGVWWLVDWIRVLAGGFKDGNGVPVGAW